VVSGILLILDLSIPTRFWHMLIESKTLQPMLNPDSPMWLGSGALLIFGGFSFLAFLAALTDAGRLRARWLARFRPPGIVGTLVALIGGGPRFFFARETGGPLSRGQP